MSYIIIIAKSVQKQIDRLPDSIIERVDQKIQELVEEPRPDGVVKLNRQEQKVVYHPCFIAEVLSSSTEGKDRGIKFRNYRRIDTFREYALISAETMMVEIYRLNAQGKWELTTYSPEDNATSPDAIDIHLTTVDLHISLALLYEDVIFPETQETAAEP